IAGALAASGADVACHGNSKAPEETCDRIRQLGRRSVGLRGDMGDPATPAALVDAAVRDLGSVDLLVNNAGTIRRAPTADTTDQDWDLVVGVNLSSVFRMCRAAGRHMLARG